MTRLRTYAVTYRVRYGPPASGAIEMDETMECRARTARDAQWTFRRWCRERKGVWVVRHVWTKAVSSER